MAISASHQALSSVPTVRDPSSFLHAPHCIASSILIKSTDVTVQPSAYTVGNFTSQDSAQKYMIFMLDLNIPDSDVTTADEYDTLVPGIAVNTTTRLHWWGGNYTVDPTTRAFVNSSDSLAQYTAPRPRDYEWHNYVFYLFNQPSDYVPSAEALDGDYYSQMSGSRFNFSIDPIVEAVGQPIAGNYILANNVSETATS